MSAWTWPKNWNCSEILHTGGSDQPCWVAGSPSFQNYFCLKFWDLKVHWSNFNSPKFYWKIMCFDQVSNRKLFIQNLSWNFCNNVQNCALYVGIRISKNYLAKILDSNLWFFLFIKFQTPIPILIQFWILK